MVMLGAYVAATKILKPETIEKIIEEMFSSFTMGETAKCLALEFRDRLFSDIKSNKISYNN